jgi:hypothetical protein
MTSFGGDTRRNRGRMKTKLYKVNIKNKLSSAKDFWWVTAKNFDSACKKVKNGTNMEQWEIDSVEAFPGDVLR